VVVVDRYAATEELKASSEDRVSGLRRLLLGLNASRRRHELTVTLFAAKDESRGEKALATAISTMLSELGRGRLAEVNLFLAENCVFAAEAHHGYVRFGSDMCFVPDPGSEVLSGCSVHRNSRYHFVAADSSFTSCESALRQSKDVYSRSFRKDPDSRWR
jgi:hypothetical protein